MRDMQCNVEFGYQLSTCSRTEENNGKPRSSWPVAGPSECVLTSSQVRINNIYEFSPYRKENTTRLHDNDQLVNAV
jgi:hypothetical protein